MNNRIEEVLNLIEENTRYMETIKNLIRLQKSDAAAEDFINKLNKRIGLELELLNLKRV